MPLSPLGERVARDGAFISRRGPGKGVPAGPLMVNNSVRQDTGFASLLDKTTLVTLGAVLTYAVYRWGGVVWSSQYEYLLVLGGLAIGWSFSRSRHDWAPLPGRLMRWATALLPAYVLLQVLPLPVAVLRLLSPARAAAVRALEPVGTRLNFAPLSVYPARTFQSFLLVCGYALVFLLVRELTCRFGIAGRGDGRWLAIWPLAVIGASEAGLGLWQYFSRVGDPTRRGTYANANHYAGFLEMVLPLAVMYGVNRLPRARGRTRVAGSRAGGLRRVGRGRHHIRRDCLFPLADGVYRHTFFLVGDGYAGARKTRTKLGGKLPKAAGGRGGFGRHAAAGGLRVSAAGQTDSEILRNRLVPGTDRRGEDQTLGRDRSLNQSLSSFRVRVGLL